MGVISKTGMNWTDKTKLHACIFTPPADLHTYSYINEWMPLSGPERHSVTNKREAEALKTDQMLVLSVFIFAFGFQRHLNRWGEFQVFVYLSCPVLASTEGQKRRERRGAREGNRCEPSSPSFTGSMCFWGQACLEPRYERSVLACRH